MAVWEFTEYETGDLLRIKQLCEELVKFGWPSDEDAMYELNAEIERRDDEKDTE